MFLDLKPEQWLGFAVLAAVVSVIGTLIGIVFKDFIFARAFENWKQRKSLNQIYQKYKDPILLSAKELCTRLIEVLDQYPPNYLRKSVLDLNPPQPIMNNEDDPYFKRYKLVSTAYRLCSFLGWLELYRQEVVFLNSGNNKHSKQLENILDYFRSDLADGQLNMARNWSKWKDMLIFREEIRAIGESMLDFVGTTRTVMGYGKFCELFDSNDTNNKNRWIPNILSVFLDLDVNLDFRKNRIIRMMNHLINLVELLDKNGLEERFSVAREKYVIPQ